MLEKDQVCKLGRGWWKLPRFEGANTNDQHPRLWNLGSGVDRIEQVIAIFVNCVDVVLQIVKTCSRTWRANMPTMLSTWMQTCHGSACQREVEAALHFGLIQRTGSKTLVGGGAEIYDIPYLFIYIYDYICTYHNSQKHQAAESSSRGAFFNFMVPNLESFLVSYWEDPCLHLRLGAPCIEHLWFAVLCHAQLEIDDLPAAKVSSVTLHGLN